MGVAPASAVHAVAVADDRCMCSVLQFNTGDQYFALDLVQTLCVLQALMFDSVSVSIAHWCIVSKLLTNQ